MIQILGITMRDSSAWIRKMDLVLFTCVMATNLADALLKIWFKAMEHSQIGMAKEYLEFGIKMFSRNFEFFNNSYHFIF